MPDRSSLFKLATLSGVLALSGVGIYILLANKPADPVVVQSYVSQPHQGGFQAHKDPVTGRFSPPTEAQKKALRDIAQKRRAKQPASRVHLKQLPDGSKEIDLRERYR